MIKEIPTYSRKELYDMTTTELIKLSGKLLKLRQRIEAELIARGDY